MSAVNPESGTTSYSYHDDGSLASRTDARGVSVNYTYDALGRNVTKSHSDSTPEVTYSYDTTDAPKIGRLQSVVSSAATEIFKGNDPDGRSVFAWAPLPGNGPAAGQVFSLDGKPPITLGANGLSGDGDPVGKGRLVHSRPLVAPPNGLRPCAGATPSGPDQS